MTPTERKIEKMLTDLETLEKHVQHMAATLVALIEQLVESGVIEVS